MSVHQRFRRGSLVGALLIPLALVLLPALARAQPLQPSVTWNTYLGGGTLSDGGIEANNADRIEDVAVIDGGDVVVTGWTNASTFPATPADAGLPMASGSDRDVFVARFSPDGQTLRWARVFGGNREDVGTAVAVTTRGVVFVVGTTASDSINVAPGSPAPLATRYNRRGREDAFLARLEPDGTLDYVMYLGSTEVDEARDIVLVPDGTLAYIVGRTGRDDGTFDKSDNTPVPFPPNNGLSNERLRAFEAFVSQVDVSVPGDAIVRWTRTLKSSENDIAYSVDVQGDAVFVGGLVGDAFNGGPSIPVRVAFQQGENDGFVARLESDAGITWFRHVGGSDDDDVRSVLARPGADGGVVVVGNTQSSNRPVPGSGPDVYALWLNREGFPVDAGLRVSTTDNGSERTEGHSAIDRYGNVYIGGRTTSSFEFARNGFDSDFAPNSDGFIAMVDSEVQRVVFTSYVGGVTSSDEWVQGVVMGSGGQLFFGGFSSASNWFPAPIGYDRTANGGTDGFLFNVALDSRPPTPGTVTAQLSNGTLTASWEPFNSALDAPMTYEWGIGLSTESVEERGFEFVGGNRSITLDGFLPAREGPFYVVVRGTNVAGQSVIAASNSFRASPRPDAGADGGTSDGGTSDGGVDAGSGDGGTDDGEGDDRSPVGWSCASGGGAGSLALTGLLVMLVLLAMRRERSAGARD